MKAHEIALLSSQTQTRKNTHTHNTFSQTECCHNPQLSTCEWEKSTPCVPNTRTRRQIAEEAMNAAVTNSATVIGSFGNGRYFGNSAVYAERNEGMGASKQRRKKRSEQRSNELENIQKQECSSSPLGETIPVYSGSYVQQCGFHSLAPSSLPSFPVPASCVFACALFSLSLSLHASLFRLCSAA